MRVVADQVQVDQLINRLADAVKHDMGGAGSEPWAVIGIRSRGDIIARRLAERIGVETVGTLDITLYRDDLSEIGPQPIVRTTDITFAVDGLQIVLVDDVLMSGRSVRAALQSLMDFGRPRRVWLSILVDRGGRELPIQPDHVALDMTGGQASQPIGQDEQVDVLLTPTDDRDAIIVRPAKQEAPA